MTQILSSYLELEMADLDPVAIYAELHKHSADAFMFESVEGSEKFARYTFVGFRPLEIVKTASYDELAKRIEAMAAVNELPFFHKGYVGFFTFESVADIEPKLRCAADKSPHMYMQLVGTMVVFDRVLRKIYLIANSFTANDTKSLSEKRPDARHASPSKRSLLDVNEHCEGEHNNADGTFRIGSNQAALTELKSLVEQAKALSTLSCDTKVTLADLLKSPEAVVFKSNTSEEQFYTMVAKAKQHILDGDVFQVVLSRKLSADVTLDPLLVYRLLRVVNPSPYLFIYNVSDFANANYALVGSSPEMLVKSTLHEHSNADEAFQIGSEYQAEIRPIAGTYPRGKTAEEDEHNAKTLLADEKECAEHVMLIDLARNDLGRVAQSGTVTVAQQMIIEKYSHVMHIVSSVIAKLKSSLDLKSNARLGIDLLKACFPAGTLSGAPKLEAIDIITELESEPRRSYGGAIGYFSLDGRVDTAIMIRTLVVEPHRVHVQAGAGIVADSIAESEHRETYNKASALIKVVNLAKQESCKSK